MTQPLVVPRVFGGTLLLGPFPATTPITVVGRDGKVTGMGRDGKQVVIGRDGQVTGKGR